MIKSSDNRSTVNIALAIAVVAAFVYGYWPTYIALAAGPWRSEQEGHGPIILLAVAWLIWGKRREISALSLRPALSSGWGFLLTGLAIMAFTRSQSILMIEVASQIPVMLGVILLVGGWPLARLLWFPLAFFIFSAPPPGWALDAMTIPLKARISDVVVDLLYALHYPVAQNGVMIMIGPYEMMVKDACSGMNSIFALSAIGIYYIHEFVALGWIRKSILIMGIIPVAIAANFARVLALILIAYYAGTEILERYFHDFMGIAMFAVAICLFILLDALILWCALMVRKRNPQPIVFG